MESLELRIATLKAAGAYVREWSRKPGIYRLILPKTVWGDVSELQFDSEADAWQHAPAVESSVDAALEWLKLPEGCYWVIQGPLKDIWWARIDEPNYPIAIAGADSPSLSTTMCNAYLDYKRQRG